MEALSIDINENKTLLCPSCGSEYLHQNEVEIGWRIEDKDVYRHISNRHQVNMNIVSAIGVDSPNGYGYRRDYLVIRFDCENCSAFSELEIYQYKGRTLLSWVKVTE